MQIKHIIRNAAYVLVIVGALAWGLIGLTDFNLVVFLFSAVPAVERVTYVLVGLSAVYLILARIPVCRCDCTVCNRDAHCASCQGGTGANK